jgi:hypothetical protein
VVTISGIDEIGESGIPPCYICGSETDFWKVYDCVGRVIGFLNYTKETARINTEFNITAVTTSMFLGIAHHMVCTKCGVLADANLFREAIYAVKNNIRRFPELERDR